MSISFLRTFLLQICYALSASRWTSYEPSKKSGCCFSLHYCIFRQLYRQSRQTVRFVPGNMPCFALSISETKCYCGIPSVAYDLCLSPLASCAGWKRCILFTAWPSGRARLYVAAVAYVACGVTGNKHSWCRHIGCKSCRTRTMAFAGVRAWASRNSNNITKNSFE